MRSISNIHDPRIVKALAHPLRIRILAMLEGRTASPARLAEELDAPLGVVSYHVRTLRKLGMLELVKTRPVRGAVEHYYTAKERPRITEGAWTQVPDTVKRATIGTAVEQVGSYVNAAAEKGGFDRREAHLTRAELRLDTEGWEEVAGALGELVERVNKIQRAADKRLSKVRAPEPESAGLVLMLFEAAGFAELPPFRAAKRRTTRRRTSRASA